MNYRFYSSSSSIWLIASRYSLQVQCGIWHFPSFKMDVLSWDDWWASDVWWHRLQFTSWWKDEFYL